MGILSGFPYALALMFIILKLVGQISWSWLWVLSPIWISWAIIIIVVGVAGTISLAIANNKKR